MHHMHRKDLAWLGCILAPFCSTCRVEGVKKSHNTPKPCKIFSMHVMHSRMYLGAILFNLQLLFHQQAQLITKPRCCRWWKWESKMQWFPRLDSIVPLPRLQDTPTECHLCRWSVG